ncbi:sulfite exporter TauE/SafE family protein [Daejeonella sp. JGW-45]|uniref:sulfite exporter TauE/SafE family protein n=1 Tax=Daejeonella sp. JGW-45 TaxID=3034148 RepID=UPI0023ED3025|nr:sulfite exporter TauE/SafE family protein [Daejeonella sp. JGW-45]
MELTGYVASLFIGISLGLIGGGGSVLTVPILVYFFHVEPVLATAYSLFIVGSTSAVGAFQKVLKKEINFRVAFIFGLPSLLTVYLIRMFLIPYIPDILYSSDNIVVYRGTLTLVLFALLMIGAAIGILKPQRISRPKLPQTQGLILLGVVVGIVSGLLGAGGGFIIIPALIFYAPLDVRAAVGTSLLIIAVNSLVGFAGDLLHHPLSWKLLLVVSSLAISGTFAGHWLSGKLPGEHLKKIFGWFILLTGAFILMNELLF